MNLEDSKSGSSILPTLLSTLIIYYICSVKYMMDCVPLTDYSLSMVNLFLNLPFSGPKGYDNFVRRTDPTKLEVSYQFRPGRPREGDPVGTGPRGGRSSDTSRRKWHDRCGPSTRAGFIIFSTPGPDRYPREE